ncbi:hypothetical protein Misp02_37550 [Microtetraspora sp. NBRC 16547]|nr:hypothetical protein Misp02_37550 [Microtetraspora sp. NBRC 16547]
MTVLVGPYLHPKVTGMMLQPLSRPIDFPAQAAGRDEDPGRQDAEHGEAQDGQSDRGGDPDHAA